MPTQFAKGDRVRVTLEGEVSAVMETDPDGKTLELRLKAGETELGHPLYHFVYTDSATVEKVEPPVEVFEPGDVVRRKGGDSKYSLAGGGYVSLQSGVYFPWDEVISGAEHFSSKKYERVELG